MGPAVSLPAVTDAIAALVADGSLIATASQPGDSGRPCVRYLLAAQ